jgi:glycosyltransferase 2 family protein
VSRKRLLSGGVFAAKLAATIFAFWLITRSIDIGAAVGAMRNASVVEIGFALALLGGQVVTNGVRWSLIARSCGVKLPPVDAVFRFWESLFFGQLTPSGVGGDAWRVYAVAGHGPGVANAMNSVIVDRVVGMATLVLMVFCGFSAELVMGNKIDTEELIAGAGLTVALIAGVLVAISIQKLPANKLRIDRFGILAACRNISVLLGQALSRPSLLLVTAALSAVGQILSVLAAWTLARAVGFDPGIGVCLMVIPLAIMISMIPITIAGWGLREGVVAAGLVRAGASLENAAAVSLLFGLGLAFLGVSGGIRLWLARRPIPPPDLQTREGTSP